MLEKRIQSKNGSVTYWISKTIDNDKSTLFFFMGF